MKVLCEGCGVFWAECLAGADPYRKPMCWPCGHAYSRHGAADAVCDCKRAAIYPPRYHEERGLQ